MVLATELPVARVLVDVSLPHLDRPFDYAVPASMADLARPGTRVRVRFGGQDVDGFVLDRLAASAHDGRLTPLRRVVSAEQVLTPEVFRAARAVADRYAGVLPDVLRLAVPPRHAAAEAQPRPQPPPVGPAQPPPVGPAQAPPVGPVQGPAEAAVAREWAAYGAGPAFLQRLAAGQAPRAVWTALPGPGWAGAIAAAVQTSVAAGRGCLVVLPDRRDVDALDVAVTAALGPGRHARLEADLGPAERYRAFLALLRGDVSVAIGTRAAAFAPVRDLGLVVIWDDGDDSHAEPRAPYPHAREVLVARAELEQAGMLLGGWSRSAEAAQLVEQGWAREIDADRGLRRRSWARVVVAGAEGGPGEPGDPGARAARMPTVAWRAVHDGLARGPVLVQVPRAGYLPGTSCQRCRAPARCPDCHGPLQLPGPGGPAGAAGERVPGCAWCGRLHPGWSCPACAGRRLRARSVGVERTAEELGRAFPGASVTVSRAAARSLPMPGRRGLVLATPGVEPPVPDGYAAAVLLDGDLLLERPDLRAAEEALRRWRAAAALVRPPSAGGVVVVCADPGAAAVQALVRADPGGHAARELAERAALGLPPTVALATLTGDPEAVNGLLAAARLPEQTMVLGPAPFEPVPGRPRTGSNGAGEDAPAAGAVGQQPPVRCVLRAPLPAADELAAALKAAAAVRSARRDPGRLRLCVDARDLG